MKQTFLYEYATISKYEEESPHMSALCYILVKKAVDHIDVIQEKAENVKKSTPLATTEYTHVLLGGFRYCWV